MNKLFAIAGTVYKESLRSKVIISLIIIAVLIIFASLFMSPIALGETERIVKDIGLSSISFFSLLIVLLSGTRLVYQETEKKTIYMIITKPISRARILWGKYLGLLSVIFTIGIITGLFLLFVVIIAKCGLNWNLPLSILFIFLQFVLLSAIAIFFSTFTSPVMSGIFTIMTYIIGFLIKDMAFFIEKTDIIFLKWIIKGIMLIVPNFYYTDIKLQAIHSINISFPYIIFVICYSLIYSLFFMYISTLIFEAKEF